MIKKTKLILIIFFSFLIILITYFTFNYNLRRTILTYIFVTHDYYQFKRLSYDLQRRNFSNVSKKILNYIDISKKFTDKKSYMIPGIYKAIELAVSKAIEQDDYNYLEKPLIELLEMEPNLYKPNVWLARALSDNDYNESIALLKKAISLSPAQEDAYREILRISQITKKNKLIKEYCDNFFISQLGGTIDHDYGNLFGYVNLKKFAIKFNSEEKDQNFYIHSGIKLGKFINYEFIPTTPLDLNGVNLYFSFLSGIKINISEIILHSQKGHEVIQTKDLIITSNSSYIENNNDQISIFSLNEGDEIIRIIFRKDKFIFKKIEKIELKINFEKMSLTNNFYCN
jgi:hypothetical protein